MPTADNSYTEELYKEMPDYVPEFFSGKDADGNPVAMVDTEPADTFVSRRENRASEIKRWLGVAISIHSRIKICTFYCAAHLITVSDSNDGDALIGSDITTGQVVEELRVDDMEVIYADSSSSSDNSDLATSADFFKQTTYGRLFLELEFRKVSPSLRVL